MKYSRIEDLLEAFLPNKQIVRIEVIKKPNKLVYNDGDIIDFTAIEVGGFGNDNSFVKTIPFEELIFPVTIVNNNN